MSRYPNVRPKKKDRGRHQSTRQPSRQEAELQRLRELQRAAEELFTERGGARIDAAIKRADRLLAIQDREAEALLADEPHPHRWTVSPQMILRLQAEIERLQKRREELMDECYALVRDAADQFARDAQSADQGRASSEQKLATDEALPHKEGDSAEAGTRAA